MKRISKHVIAWAFILGILSSCGLKNSTQEVFEAPLTQDDAGIIARCTSVEKAQTIAKTLNIKYRVLSKNQNIVEFFGANSSEIQKYIINKHLISNQVYPNLIEQNSNVTSQGLTQEAFINNEYRIDRVEEDEVTFSYLKQVQVDGHLNKDLGKNVVVAIIDSGVAYNHPHLNPNIIINTNENPNKDFIDNDGNGFKDDLIGWDFVEGDSLPWDDNGHGTHVAGLVAGTINGVAPYAKILPIKVLRSNGSGDLGSILAGILYALQRKADVINLSLGGSMAGMFFSDLAQFSHLLDVARNQDSLLVVAAGNGGSDGIGDCNDENPLFPASVLHENLIAVAAVNQNNQLTSYSNFGGASVHIAAPGGDRNYGGLISTSIKLCSNCKADVYQSMSGTSMATPIVSGLIAAMKSQSPNLSMLEIKNILFNNGIYEASLNGKVKSSKVARYIQL